MSRYCTSCDVRLPADAPSYVRLCKPCFALSKRLEVQQLHHQIERLEDEVRRLRAIAARPAPAAPSPFDLARLAQADTHPELAALADCKELAPYQRNAVLSSRWSKDSSSLAAIALGVLADGRRGEVVEIIAVDKCIANPVVQLQFPEPHFALGEYTRTPSLPGFTWDGESLFVMNGLTRNEGFGDLHIFNRETFKVTVNADPVSGRCCYRDPSFSPDGKYLLFAFQDITLGSASKTQLYYVPFGSFGTGATYQALPLPEFTNPKEAPQAVLRPVK